MNTTKLLLLALNCIRENRAPSYVEQSRINVFYRTKICNKNISINEFMFDLNQIQIEEPRKKPVIDLIYTYICKSEEKKHAQSLRTIERR